MINEVEHNDLGRIDNAGTMPKGSRIDRYWNKKDPKPKVKRFFDKILDKDWLKDSHKAWKHFDLMGIEFGNWLNEQDKVNYLYASALSLHHLARVLKVKDNQMGLGGKLALSLAGRGYGGTAVAHFEPEPRSVINLTKTESEKNNTILKGKGALAHEFAHAIDNLLSYHLSRKPKKQFLSGGSTTRKNYNQEIAKKGNWFEKQFEELFKDLYWKNNGEKTDFQTHLQKSKSNYLQRRNEVFARTFEKYVWRKLKSRNIENTFLVERSYNHPDYPSDTLMRKVSRRIEDIMDKAFQVTGSTGLAGVAVGVSGYAGFRKTLKENGNLDDTLGHMKKIALRDTYQVEQLARKLQGNTTKDTCRNIWNYLRENTKYKKDNDGIEELRTPARSIYDGHTGLTDTRYGIDCDDYTILISAMLLNLGIDHEYRAVAYNGKGEFQHIYPVAFGSQDRHYVIDCVPEIPRFNYEAKPIIDQKTVNMEIHELSGLGTGDKSEEKQRLLEEFNEPFTLDGLDDDLDDEILEANFLAGFEEVDDEDEADIVLSGSEVLDMVEKGLLAEVAKAKKSLMEEMANPTVLSQTIDVASESDLLDELIDSWQDGEERRDVLLQAIQGNSPYRNFYKSILISLDKLEQQDELHGFDEVYLARVDLEDGEDLLDEYDQAIDEMNGFENVYDEEDYEEEMGAIRLPFRNPTRRTSRTIPTGTPRSSSTSRSKRRKRRKKGRIKNLFKKVGKTIKKGVKAVVRYNPATITARNTALATLKNNAGGISAKLIYGYLTEDQARAKGLDIEEWRKLKKAVETAEKYFKKIGGKPENFRNAVVKGRARKKTGLQLGIVQAGLGAFVADLLQKINIGKLFKGKDPAEMGIDETDTTNLPAMPGDDVVETEQEEEEPDGKGDSAFMEFIKSPLVKWSALTISGLAVIFIFIAIVRKFRKRKKNQLRGITAARTRAVNKAIEAERMKHRSRGRKRTTTTTKTKSNNGKRTRGKSSPGRGRKISNANRFKEMHRIAKQMQKQHPKTKYSVLLGRAAKQIK